MLISLLALYARYALLYTLVFRGLWKEDNTVPVVVFILLWTAAWITHTSIGMNIGCTIYEQSLFWLNLYPLKYFRVSFICKPWYILISVEAMGFSPKD